MITRRKVLLGVAATGGAAVAGGSIIASFGGDDEDSGSGGSISLTLAKEATGTATDWPFRSIPTAKEIKSDPTAKALHEALQSWLDDNPGVRLRNISVKVYDQQPLVTVISGGNGPALYPTLVLGGWDQALTKAAFAQGLAADITGLYNKYKFDDKVADFAAPQLQTWPLKGRQYAMPDYFNAGNGIYYRRDLIKKAGLEEPEPGYTWDDLRKLARELTTGKMKGAAFQKFSVGWPLNANGWYRLPKVPAPKNAWHWTYDYTRHADMWVKGIELYRAMVYEDKSVLSDISLMDPDVVAAFSQERAAVFGANIGGYFDNPDQDNTLPNLAKRLDKPMEEVVGFIQHPVGVHGSFGVSQPYMGLASFSPDLSEDALDKIVSLHDFMTFGDGFVIRKKARWEETKDLKKVYNDATPINGMTEIEGIPGSLEDAWGSKIVEAAKRSSALGLIPSEAQYIPAEEKPGPAATPVDDAQSRWAFEKGTVRPRADLAKLSDTFNQQAKSFSSSTSEEDFRAGATKYFDALAEFWREQAPEYATEVFDPWMKDVIEPALEA